MLLFFFEQIGKVVCSPVSSCSQLRERETVPVPTYINELKQKYLTL
ncbi:hypothetical protein KIS4809_2284 [Bacillus sp. ZZV12-4809]|nr:hypothetical protein KIS4809_2284 [Bacillus sp. ZZV12-4809]